MKNKIIERFKQQKEALSKGDIQTVKRLAAESRKELEKRCVYAFPLGWIEKDWLAKGLKENAIVFKNKRYYPVVNTILEEKVVGYRGKNPIKEKKTINDLSKFLSFIEEYEKFKKSKEHQRHFVEESFRGLIGDEVRK